MPCGGRSRRWPRSPSSPRGRHGRHRSLPSARGRHPRKPRRLPLPRRIRPGALRRQGQQPPRAPEQLLRAALEPPRAHPADGTQRGLGRVDRRRHRVRGPAARVHLDQGIRPAVQCQVPRRQDLPVPRHHPRRPRAEGAHHPQPQALRSQVLRAVHEGLGDPRDRRPDAQGVPDAQLQRVDLQACRADGPAVPPRGHRQVRRAVRRSGLQGGAQVGRARLRLVHGRERLALPRRAHGPDEDGRRHPGLRVGRALPRPARRPRGRPLQERRGAAGRHRHRHLRDRPRRARGRGPAVPRPRRSHPRCAQLGRRQGARPRPARPRRHCPAEGL